MACKGLCGLVQLKLHYSTQTYLVSEVSVLMAGQYRDVDTFLEGYPELTLADQGHTKLHTAYCT